MGKTKDKYIKVINGQYWARITYIDKLGKRRELKRKAENKTHAKQLVQDLLFEIRQHGVDSFESANMTFFELADYYEKRYLIDPVYVEGRKIAGLRGHYEYKLLLKVLKDFFGAKKIKAISYGDLEAYRLKRLSTPIVYKDKEKEAKQRSLASVNRELALLRRILNIAHREGWVQKNPFQSGDKLISVADEKKRNRILTRTEEIELLQGCVGLREHLKPILICALDTGMRAGEIFSLRWKDVDLNNNKITIHALNTKTLQSRQIALTVRLKLALVELSSVAKSIDDLVFGVGTVRRSFNTLCKYCNIKDLHFHDLRHTAATRMIQKGTPLQEVGRILGHTQANTTYRYINIDNDSAKRVASLLDEFNEETKSLLASLLEDDKEGYIS